MGDVLQMDPLGLTCEFLRTGEETGGELLEMEVTGHPRGFLAQKHVHPTQSEHIEVVSGAITVAIDGRERLVTEGQSIDVPAGIPHTQVPVGAGAGVVRIQVRPAGRTQTFLEHVARLCHEGKVTRSGFPRPVAGAELVLEYGDTGHAAVPSLRVQRAIARAIRAVGNPMRPYLFVDEWDVAAPPDAVFDAIADGRSYPKWWRPVYIDVTADGPAALGAESSQHFKGRLPYHLHTRSVITALDAPHTLTVDVTGDLRGRGTWTLTASERGARVRFEWQVHADRALLRVLTPVLRPVLRWNHNWAIARAMDGLEPYAQRAAARLEPVA